MDDRFIFWGLNFDDPFVFWFIGFPIAFVAFVIFCTVKTRWDEYRARIRYEKYIKEHPPMPDNLTREDFADDPAWECYVEHYLRFDLRRKLRPTPRN